MSAGKIILFMALLLGMACEKNSVGVIAGGTYSVRQPDGDFSHIADPRKRWQAYQLRDYVILQKRVCFCLDADKSRYIVVRNGEVIDVLDVDSGESLPKYQWDWYDTIEELFDLADRIDSSDVAFAEIKYDPRFGYPVSINVDWQALVADDELWVQTGNLMQLVR